MKKIWILSFLFSATALQAQVPYGYFLIKAHSSSSAPGSINHQWIASNLTSASGNFYILENVPLSFQLQSVLMNGSYPLIQSSKQGPVTIGPFPIVANSSVTLNFNETGNGVAPQGTARLLAGETFTLLSEKQLTGKNSPLVSVEGLGTSASSDSSANRLVRSLTVAPNISKDNQPVNFFVNLNSPAQVSLSIFALTGELVYSAQAQGNDGTNSLIWETQNNARQTVASGLYIYVLQAAGNGVQEEKSGKILIVH